MAPISKQSSASGASTASEGTKKPKKVGKSWSEAEEAHFLDLINSVLSSHLWSAAKQSGLLVNRGSDGVNKHWKAMYKRMRSKKP